MTLALVQHNLELQARADRVAALEPESRRREAVRAARDADPDALWALVEAFLVTHGRRGARVSDHTLSSYQKGLTVFLDWAGPAGVSLLRPGGSDGYRFTRHLEGLKLAPSSVRTRLAAARALYGALRWSGATDSSPFTDVRTAPDPTPRHEKRKPYTDADLAAMLLAAGPQESVILLLGAHCGLPSSFPRRVSTPSRTPKRAASTSAAASTSPRESTPTPEASSAECPATLASSRTFASTVRTPS